MRKVDFLENATLAGRFLLLLNFLMNSLLVSAKSF